jgi:glycosyltransferase involved in cell wall biosynthesis
MAEIALCVPTLNRTDRLERLLESAEGRVDRVVVADNGKPSDEKDALYERDWAYELTPLSLGFDVGVGACRAEAFKAVRDADYLLAADDDHALTDGVSRLAAQLDQADSIGGIAGNLIEPTEGRVWQSAKDFRETPGESRLIRTANCNTDMEMVDGQPFVPFDFIPYPTLFRIKCIEDYCWDREYPLGRTHADFYVGHWKQTDWRFGINPAVSFRHYPGGDEEYESHRRDEAKVRQASLYFRQKWGYNALLGDQDNQYWFDTDA